MNWSIDKKNKLRERPHSLVHEVALLLNTPYLACHAKK